MQKRYVNATRRIKFYHGKIFFLLRNIMSTTCRLSNWSHLSLPLYIYTCVCLFHLIATQHSLHKKRRKKSTMSSSADNKTCGICSASLATGQGQAMFTSECSHCFHFSCITNYVSHGNRLCPICFTVWKHHLPLPFVAPVPNTRINFSNTFNFPVHNPPFQFPQPHVPLFEPEPLHFSDDEPLPDTGADPMSTDSLVDSQKVTLKAIPEHPALAASQSASLFAVLVGLKAPSLSDDARSSQRQRAPIDIVTVLDVSGSMSGKKLDLVKRAVHFVIDNLGVSDRLSIVSFCDRATRMLPLRRMTESGREDAKRAVSSLRASGGTNIVDGLKKGAQVLDERRHKNPVTSIIFLSDGNDTYNLKFLLQETQGFMHLLPRSSEAEGVGTTPVHSFGFGSDHDPITMHGISDASGGTFSFIESIEMVQDAFASCIGGLLSVVTQELRVKLRSASHGVEIKSIPSGRYRSEICNQGSEGVINVGDLYADEEKEFLINLSIPISVGEGKTSLLDITCSYRDAVSKQTVVIEGDLVEIGRPKVPSPQDLAVNLEVDRQRNRLRAAESIQEAQQMAEAGNLRGATNLLATKRSDLMATASAQAGDGLMKWLEGEMKETEIRMGSSSAYMQSGRAFALSGMSSHASQRATTRGSMVAGAALFGSAAPRDSFGFGAPVGMAMGGYATPQMAKMVTKSQQQNKAGEESSAPMKE